MIKEVLAKFECRCEQLDEDFGGLIAYSFYSEDGGYIGRVDNFKKLVIERGIMPQKVDASDKVCSIGKSTDGKWYGWSHRAIYGFSIGDVVNKGDCCASSGWTKEYLKTHDDPHILPVGFEAKIEEDCKRMAIAFASSVG